MPETKKWYEDDDLWVAMEPFLFDAERMASAPVQIENLITLLQMTPGMSVLDLCCGVGRHTLELARRGYYVTAVDRTRPYLEKAIALAEAEGLQVQFVQQDMREFSRAEEFHLVINMFTSFGYFDDPEDDRRVLRNVLASLKPGGVMVIESVGKEILARIYQETDWLEKDGVFLLEKRHPERNWGWMVNRWILIDDHQRKEINFGHRLFAATELCALMQECGFTDTRAYADLTGAPYDQNAKRLVVIGRKAS